MSNTAILQVRAKPELISRAQKRASALGYSSLQEIIRIFLQSFAAGLVVPTVVSTKRVERFPAEYIKLGPKAKKRWVKIMAGSEKDKARGDFIITDSVDELMDYLEK